MIRSRSELNYFAFLIFNFTLIAMGKKKVAEQTSDEALKTGDKIDLAVSKSSASGKKSKKLESGRVYINVSYNNTVITVTDLSGNVVAWSSAGALGFNGPKKATPFAASRVVATIAEKIQSSGPTAVDIIVKGIGGGRDSAIRSLINQGLNVNSIKDVTPIPHNGPRPEKIRRV